MDKLRKKLYELGFSPAYKGFDFIARAVEITKANNCNITMTRVFEQVAKENNEPCGRISRSIDTAIRGALRNGTLSTIFNNVPTTKDLIFLLAKEVI